MKLFENKIAANASWIIMGKLMQSVIALIVNMFTARYLGPGNYGLISYASSIVAFAVPIMNLGLTNVLVQEYTDHPEEEGEITCTSLCLSLVSAAVCIVNVVFYSVIADKNELHTTLVVFLYSLSLIFQAFELIQYWFQAKLLSKYMAIISFAIYCLVALYKISLLIIKATVYWFAVSNSIELGLIALCLYVTYKKLGGKRFRFSRRIGKRMISKSKHYIVSTLMVTLFAQTDKIMIKSMINDAAVGYYSAAVTCAGLTGFVFAAIIDSFRPAIFMYRKSSNFEEYEKAIQRLYCIIIYAALMQCIIISVFAKQIIGTLYGNEYFPAVSALQIVVWYTTFAYMGSVRNIWILSEGKQRYLWILNLGGAIMNIVLNALLIPCYGIYGAAFASFLTQLFANVFMNILILPLRHNMELIRKGLNPKLIFELFNGRTE